VILIRYLHAWLSDSNPLSAFMPLAVKAFFVAIVFAVPWVVWVLVDRGQSSQQHKSSSKGATQ
jgi:hypothetical protein